jgi:hypothetical protein
MPIPVAAHFEYEHRIKGCSGCGGGPIYKLIINVEDIEAVLDPYCPNCLLNRVMHGFVAEEIKSRMSAKKIRRASRKQEQQIMDGIGGRVQPGSGCVDGYKSDGRLKGRVRVEAKFTFGTIFSVKRADLDKIRGECQGRERPAFVIDFKERASGKTQDRWVLVPHKDWESMINAAADDS